MAKGYWIARVDVTDPDAYPNYVAANAKAFEIYGARFVVRGGKSEVMEGEGRSRNVVIEFDSYDIAMACYKSPEYTGAKKIKVAASEGDLIIVEGVEED